MRPVIANGSFTSIAGVPLATTVGAVSAQSGGSCSHTRYSGAPLTNAPNDLFRVRCRNYVECRVFALAGGPY